jgi:hypothetical protein
MDHHAAMRAHALRRFRERTGTVLAADEYEAMCSAIRRDNLPPAAVTRDSLRFYKVRVRGVTAYALWKRGTIATFYPSEDWIIQRGGQVLTGEAA